MLLIILFFVAGLAMSAFFSGSETGFYRLTRLRLVMDGLSGDRTSQLMLRLVNQPSMFVATALVGNNVANYLSSLAVVNLKGKLGAAFGSYGWSGEAVRMIEDRMRGLKMHIPRSGMRVKLIPTAEELEACHAFGLEIAEVLVGKSGSGGVIDFADLA